MKRFVCVFALLLSFYLGGEPLKFEIKGEAAILMNGKTGAILYEQKAQIPAYPASTTKVATAIYALKKAGDNLEMSITAEPEALGTRSQESKRKSKYSTPPYELEPDGTHIGIKKGEIFSLRVLLEGLLIASANDAANVIAQTLGPSIPVFMEELNGYLKEIGCKQTMFMNPHGLHHPEHQTTPFDLALMAKEGLKDPIFSEIVAMTRFIRPKTNMQAATTYLQSNRLLRPGQFFYPRAIGVKTGYIAKAKNTFIGAAKADGRTLIVVLLGYPSRSVMFEDAIKLFETAFNQPKVQRTYLKEGLQSFALDLPKGNKPLNTYLEEPLSLDYYPAEDPQAKCLLYWDSLSLPIMKGQKVGELRLVSSEGLILKNTSLLAQDEVSFAWPHNWIACLASMRWDWILGGFIFAAALFFLIRFGRSNKSQHFSRSVLES